MANLSFATVNFEPCVFKENLFLEVIGLCIASVEVLIEIIVCDGQELSCEQTNLF